MNNFICPICKKSLVKNEKTMICGNKHCFDISKYGYVNLLMSQKTSAKRHGDDKLMVKARQEFLDKGFYNPLLYRTTEVIKKYFSDQKRLNILDAGCGDCFYTSHILNEMKSSNFDVCMYGVDISKDALVFAHKRNKEINLAVASIFNIPVRNNSCDLILNFFAPLSSDEYARILNRNGLFIRAIPLEMHLMGLKQRVYDEPYKNKLDDFNLDGFELIQKEEIKDIIHLKSNNDIQNLFKMTPYYYKTSVSDQGKINNLDSLETETEFGLLVYKKK